MTDKTTKSPIDEATGVIRTPSTGEGVVTAPSTGEGVVQLDGARAAAAARVVATAKSPIDDATGVILAPSTGEGVVTTPSTGEGVVQLEEGRAADAARVAAAPPGKPGPHAPPANDATIDRSTVSHDVDESTIDGTNVAGRDAGQGPTPAQWTPQLIAAELERPHVAGAIAGRLADDAEAGQDSTARQFVELLGTVAAERLADGIARELKRLELAEILEGTEGHASPAAPVADQSRAPTSASSPAESSGSSPVPDSLGAPSVGGASTT